MLVQALAPLSEPSPPPRRRAAQFGGGRPAFRFHRLVPPVADPGEPLLLSWGTLGADEVWLYPEEVRLPATGVHRIDPPAATGAVSLELAARNPCGEVRVRLASGVRTSRTMRLFLIRPAVLVEGVGNVDDQERAVLSPLQVHRVSIDEARERVRAAFAAHGIDVGVEEPGWVEDEVLLVDRDGTAACERAVEQLAGITADAVGGEDACWLALLPEGDVPSHLAVPGDAARVVAAADVQRLVPVVREIARLVASGALLEPTRRLRLVGRQLGPESVEWTSRMDVRRPAGPGAVSTSNLVAVVHGAGGELARVPVRRLRDSDQARFVALVPVDPRARSLELHAPTRRGLSRIATVFASEHAPSVTGVRLDEGTLRWSYRHPWSARPQQFVELVRRGVASPIGRPGPCSFEMLVPTHRFGPGEDGDRLRVTVTDGWNTQSEDVEVHGLPEVRVALRSAGERRYWADVESRLAIRWRFLGEDGEEAVLERPGAAVGVASVVAFERTDAVVVAAGRSGTLILETADGEVADRVSITAEVHRVEA